MLGMWKREAKMAVTNTWSSFEAELEVEAEVLELLRGLELVVVFVSLSGLVVVVAAAVVEVTGVEDIVRFCSEHKTRKS